MSEQMLRAEAHIEMMLRENETLEEAKSRLYELLMEGLCNTADHQVDFWVNEVE